jgi:4-amino-4-deoxy-L-arabinose transferase-like glycosyltransferase
VRNTPLFYNILIIGIAALLFIPFLGYVNLFDWDEINFAECAREMIVSHDFSTVQINFEPFWEKPPLFIWMQAFSMLIFGVNEFAARFPNAVCGIVTLIVLFNVGRKVYDDRFGLAWCLAFAGSLLPHFYFKSGIIDPWFNLFIFLGIYRFILYTNDTQKTRNICLSALFIGLAILTKGPVALIIFFLCAGIYALLKRFRSFITVKDALLFLLVLCAVGGSWFMLLLAQGKADVILAFLRYQARLFSTEDAGHGGPFYYHFVVLLVGCFPASVFAIRALSRSMDTPFHRHFKRWMIILFLVVLTLFTIVQTKIIHYSSLCWFPLSYLAAYSVYKLSNGELQWKKWMSWAMLIIGIILGTAFTLIQFVDHYKERIISSDLIKDPFAVENLKAQVNWTGYEFLVGLLFLAGIFTCTFIAPRRKYSLAMIFLFFIMLITTNLATIIFAPKIEKYTQAAAIDFYEGLKGRDCYVETLYFKSYANMFYARTKEKQDEGFMLSGPLTKPAYFVSKIIDADKVRQEHPQLTEVGRKNGFVFWERLPAP